MTEQCTWIGEGEGCTHQAVKGRSYCEQHIWLVYQQGSAVRRKKDQRRANAVWDIAQAFQEACEELEAEGYDLSEPRWDAEVSET